MTPHRDNNEIASAKTLRLEGMATDLDGRAALVFTHGPEWYGVTLGAEDVDALVELIVRTRLDALAGE